MREGWEIKKMSEVYDVRDGTHASPKYIEEGYPLITSKNLKDGIVTFDKIKYISEEDYIEINKRSKVDIGDVLFAMIGTIGNPTLVIDEPLYAIKNVALFKVDSTQNSQYLKYYLESQIVIDKMLKDAKGSTQSFVGLGYLRQFPIPIPPLQEQQQIVAILDQAFEAIDQAKANIEKNIANAKELFQSKLNAIFSQKGDGWEEKSFKEVCILQRGFDLPTRLRKKGKYDLVTSSGINDSHSEYKVEGPGVVTGRSGSIGNVFYVENNFWPLNTALYIKDFKNNNEKYIYYFLRHFDLSKYSTGTGVPTLNRNFVHDEKVNTANNIKEQIEIVQVLDLLIIKNKLIESNYKQKLTNLEDLKKSILQKAFAGELTNKEESVHLKLVAEPEARYSKK
jgi:type I restriction enzyme S subunit